MRFAKGHGTGNDFVILPDPDGALDLPPQLVRALCDRRFGVGGDGVLRVVRAAKHPDGSRYAPDAEWFMDYHNADGSIAEMCGNGARVYTRYLLDNGLAEGPAFTVATRAGLVRVAVAGPDIEVELRRPVLGPPSRARIDGTDYPGTACSVGNPHLVCPVAELSTVDLSRPPAVDPGLFPDGVNVEFTAQGEPVPGADRHVHMRVYERGSAETLSCGSGACAVAEVELRAAGRSAGTVAVDLPGGRLTVTLDGDTCRLRGPAVIVATGTLYR